MKNGKTPFKIESIALMAMSSSLFLFSMDLLPSSTCQNLENITLLHRCDPYIPHLNIVKEYMLRPVSPRHEPVVWRSASEKVERRVAEPKKSSVESTAVKKRIEKNSKKQKNVSTSKSREKISAPEVIEDNFDQEVEGVTFVTVESRRRKNSRPKRQTQYEKKKEVVHIVQRGESLFMLAKRYETTVYDILKLNGLGYDDVLRYGQKLKIIVGLRTPLKEIRKTKMLKKVGRYRIKKGDSLLKIARRFGVDKKAILDINGLKKADFLIIGQVLYLPLSKEKMSRILDRERRKRLAEAEKKRKKQIEEKLKREKKIALKYVDSKRFKHKIRVQATAYTSHSNQTDSTPFIAAWNNRIRPGMKIIAVSPDLIRRYGITNGTRVKISGLPGIYVVRDKMNNRLRNHIDIYMGTNRRRALRWGRRSVILSW